MISILETLSTWSEEEDRLLALHTKNKQTTTTTKPFVPSIWDRLHEPKENYAGSGTLKTNLYKKFTKR